MRGALVLALLASASFLAPIAAAQDPTSEELASLGRTWMVVTFVLLALGAAAMYWVLKLYHPPGEKVRAKSRKD